jgi:CRP/FNR family transcriptional regulator, cyclic AMP receptor protein
VIIASAESYRDVLREGRWFASLSPESQDWFLLRGVVREYSAGQAVCKQGEKPDGLYAVLEGAVLLKSVQWGHEFALSRMEPPTWFGEASVFDQRPRTHDAIAEERSICLYVNHDYIQEHMNESATFVRELGESLANKLRMLVIGLSEMAALPLGIRVARRLLSIAEGYGTRDEVAPRRIAIRQEQLASMLAVSRQTVNQALKDLEARGAVRLAYGEIEIVDVPALKAAAQVQASILPPPP